MKLRSLLLWLFAICCLTSKPQAQIIRSLLSPEQEMVQKALDSTLYIIRVDYVLQAGPADNPRSYGQGNASWFNRFYFFAIHIDSCLVALPRAKTPWVNDPDFNLFRNIDSIKPVVSSIHARQVVQGNFAPVTFGQSAMQDTLTHLSLKIHGKGLEKATCQRDSTGWVVMLYLDSAPDADTLKYRFTTYKPNPRFDASGTRGTIREPSDAQKVFGGLYVTPFITRGNISLKAWGLANNRPGVGWHIVPLNRRTITLPQQSDVLTPIQNQ